MENIMQNRQVPSYSRKEYVEKINEYCVCVFVINEGERLLQQLERMQPICRGIVDVVVADGGSTDGSTEDGKLKNLGVNTLLVKTGPGKLGSQMRMAFDWALNRGYKGVVCVDGNGKDGIEAILDFVKELRNGVDHVQGSRFIPGGHHENTPKSRLLGVKLLHAPLISLASGFHYTDTTNGFRAYSAKLLSSEEIDVFRDCFTGYELHYYLAVEAVKQGFSCKEIPVSRIYPPSAVIPSKINSLKGKIGVLECLFDVAFGKYASTTLSPKFKLKKFGLSFVLLFVCWCIGSTLFLSNNDFDEWSEGLVLSSIIAKEKGIQPWYGSPMLGVSKVKENSIITPHGAPIGRSIYTNDAWKDCMIEDCVLSEYPPQLGMSAILNDLLVKIGFDKLSQLRRCNSIFTGLVLSIIGACIVCWMGYSAICGLLILFPLLCRNSGDLYWSFYSMLLPIAVLCLAYTFRDKATRAQKSIMWVVYGFSLFFRCCFGYEYYPCIVIASCIPLVFCSICAHKTTREIIRDILMVLCISILAFSLNIVTLGLVVGLGGVLNSATNRIIGSSICWEYMGSAVYPLGKLPLRILRDRNGVIAISGMVGYLSLWILLFFSQTYRVIKTKSNQLAFFLLWAVANFSILSWIILVKPHVVIHTWLLCIISLFIVMPFICATGFVILCDLLRIRFFRNTLVISSIIIGFILMFFVADSFVCHRKMERILTHSFQIVTNEHDYILFANQQSDLYILYRKTKQFPDVVEISKNGCKKRYKVNNPGVYRLSRLPHGIRNLIISPYKKIDINAETECQ